MGVSFLAPVQGEAVYIVRAVNPVNETLLVKCVKDPVYRCGVYRVFSEEPRYLTDREGPMRLHQDLDDLDSPEGPL